MQSPSLVPGPPTTVVELFSAPELSRSMKLVAGRAGQDRLITHPRIQKSGLALAGHLHGIVPTRVQILGETELSYLEALDGPTRTERLASMMALNLSVVVVTRGVPIPVELTQAADATGTPLMRAMDRSSAAIANLHSVLDRMLAPRVRMHGVMVEVYGLGIFLSGKSGIGKSECALFLVERGHRLVADDAVDLVRMPEDRIVGSSPPMLRHHLEIRGLGILNIRDLFGATAVVDDSPLCLVVELASFEERDFEADRLGIEDAFRDVLGVPIPLVRVPVRPGRDMGVLLEVAARNQILKRAGIHAAKVFVERVDKRR